MNNDLIIRNLAKKYGKDERVIRSIVNSPFIFAKKIINSLEDERPIRIPYLGTFVLRKHLTKKQYLSYVILKEVFAKMEEQYNAANTEEEKKAILDSVQIAIDVLIRRGYKDEPFVQHLIEWKNRT